MTRSNFYIHMVVSIIQFNIYVCNKSDYKIVLTILSAVHCAGSGVCHYTGAVWTGWQNNSLQLGVHDRARMRWKILPPQSHKLFICSAGHGLCKHLFYNYCLRKESVNNASH